MGGNDGLRGYEDDQFRGNSMLKATLEYRFPIIKKVQGVLFTDNAMPGINVLKTILTLALLKTALVSACALTHRWARLSLTMAGAMTAAGSTSASAVSSD